MVLTGKFQSTPTLLHYDLREDSFRVPNGLGYTSKLLFPFITQLFRCSIYGLNLVNESHFR